MHGPLCKIRICFFTATRLFGITFCLCIDYFILQIFLMFVNQIDCLVCHIPKIHFDRRQRRLIIFSLFFSVIPGHDNVFRDADPTLAKDITNRKCHIVIGTDDRFRPFAICRKIITCSVTLIFPEVSIIYPVFPNFITVFVHDPFKAGKAEIRIVAVFRSGHERNILYFMYFNNMMDNFIHRLPLIQ